MIRNFFSFLASLLFHAVLVGGVFWLVNQQEKSAPKPPMTTAVAFDFGELIAAKQIVSTPPPPDPMEPTAEPEPIVEPEPVTEPEPVVEPKPIVKPVVKKKVVEPKKTKPKKKVIEKKKAPKKVVKKKPKPKKKVVKKQPKKKTPPKKVVRKTPNPPVAKPIKMETVPLASVSNTPVVASRASSQSAGKKQATKVKPSGGGGGGVSKSAYRSGLTRAIARAAQRNYPPKARRMRKQGTVRVRFNLSRDGRISQISVVGSSGNNALDKAAVKALKRLGKYKAPPAGFPATLTIPIRFSLR